MGYSLLDSRYRFNGVVSTDKSVIQNLEALASACGCWLTYDVGQGQWGIIINRPGDSIASFNDSNIIGSVTVSGTGLSDLYNSVRVQFPHVDLGDQMDYIRLELPQAQRNSNEMDNTLEIQYDILNDPVQASYLASVELKQSRVDKVIKFTTDYSYLGLKAGKIIDVTNQIYGFVNKKFRVISVGENDAEDGTITLEITALEYDENVYVADLAREARDVETGIPGIGAIGIPGTPTITKYETDRRPHIVVSSTAPSGIVEGIEYWSTTDTTVNNDAQRNYEFLEVVYAPTGNLWTSGQTVTFDYDKLQAGNYIFKTRASNVDTTGPFSSPSAVVNYAPNQTTDLIDDNTKMLGTALLALPLLTKLGSSYTAKAFTSSLTTSEITTKYNAFAGTPAWAGLRNNTYGNYIGFDNPNSNNTALSYITLTTSYNVLQLTLQVPYGYFDYKTKIGGTIETRSAVAHFPSIVKVIYDDGNSSSVIDSFIVDWQTSSAVKTLTNVGAGYYGFQFFPVATYDLDQEETQHICFYNFSCIRAPQITGLAFK